MEAQLGLIGGTMGLLTGFSILSGIEIIYYLLRHFFDLLSDDYPFLQVLHVPQGPQSCHRVCCQQKIWKPFDKKGLEMGISPSCYKHHKVLHILPHQDIHPIQSRPVDVLFSSQGRRQHSLSVIGNSQQLVACGGINTETSCIAWRSGQDEWSHFATLR